MSALSIQPTYPIFTDIDGQPLEDGYVWIGTANLDPQTNPINVYWDSALTLAAAQPIRTLAGYPSNSGTPARLYVNSDYSIRVMNKNGSTVYSAPAATERYNDVVISSISASNVDFLQAGAGAELQDLQHRGRKTVFVSDYIDPSIDTSLVACQDFFQDAIDHLDSVGGGELYIPAGIYLITAPIQIKSNITVRGTGDASQLLVNTDIEVFNSDTTTVNTGVSKACFFDFFINKTFAGATTQYDIHLQNPIFCNMTRLHIKSGHNDTVYSNTNVGGIWLDRPAAATTSAFCNRIDDCWIQNNSIYFRNITDSAINGGFVWGHTRQFAIKIQGDSPGKSGAIGIENIVGIIPSKYEGGIWLDGAGLNQIRIHGNEFDGNPALDTGYGILCLEQALAVTITGNTFWGVDYHGIWAKDATSWTITGNNFYKCGARDDMVFGYDDIRLESNLIPIINCTISGNAHIVDDPRVNPGFAIRFVAGGAGSPVRCSVVGETADGSYQGNGFQILGDTQVQGNSPSASRIPNQNPSGYDLIGTTSGTFIQHCGITAAVNQLVAGLGTMDLDVNSASFIGNPGGFVGHLYVTSTRYNAPTQSRRQIYTVFCYGTTAVITSVATQDGSGGGSAFTVTVPSNGVLRFTDTSGNQVAANMTFVGARSLA